MQGKTGTYEVCCDDVLRGTWRCLCPGSRSVAAHHLQAYPAGAEERLPGRSRPQRRAQRSRRCPRVDHRLGAVAGADSYGLDEHIPHLRGPVAFGRVQHHPGMFERRQIRTAGQC